MGIADLHIHTVHSWDATCTVSAVLKYAAEVTLLDVVAITDHDCVNGALEAMELAPTYGIEVIPGCEISTADGHLLTLFIQQAIPRGLPAEETLYRVKALGGMGIAAHPTAPHSLSPELICRIARNPDLSSVLVGIETLNAGLVNSRSNRRAQGLARVLPMAEAGGSDAHLLWMIGGGATEYPGTSAADLKRALLMRQTRALIRSHSALRMIGTWLPNILLRRAGWVTGNTGPFDPVRLHRRQDPLRPRPALG